MSINKFKQALANKEAQIGLWLSMAEPYLAEISATAGFDWLLIDGEHSPYDLRNILLALQAIEPYHSHAVVRPVDDNPATIKQLLDLGAKTLLIPMVDTDKQARDIVRAALYAPKGFRGMGSGGARVSRFGLNPNYIEEAEDELCLLVQVETAKGIENLEGICQVDGINGVFIGPADLSASLGYRGQLGHPKVQEVIEKAVKTIISHNKAAGILTTQNEYSQKYLDLGATFVATGVDVSVYVNAIRKLAADFGRGLNNKEVNLKYFL